MKHNETRPACLSYGQWRTYHIETTGEQDAVIEVELSAPISATYLRAGGMLAISQDASVDPSSVSYDPTLLYDVRSAVGDRVVTGSPCDVTQPTRWHVALSLGSEAAIGTRPPPSAAAAAELLTPLEFELNVKLRSAALTLQQEIPPHSLGGRGIVCCGATRYFRLQSVTEVQRVLAHVNVTSGRVQSVLAKWGTCPTVRDIDEMRGKCSGFCAMEWLTTRGTYSGSLYSVDTMMLAVPHGLRDDPDRRRAGDWYIGVQAMPGETAQFRLTVDTDEPRYEAVQVRCDHLTYACNEDSARRDWNASGPPAPPPSLATLAYARAVSVGTGVLSVDYIADVISNDVVLRMSTVAGILLFAFFLCWCYRTYRFRDRHRYRVPHENWSGL